MFSDLDKLEVGDVFYIEALGQTLQYRVYAKETVLPSEIDKLAIQEGDDLATLITCTPFGVNTHRLLVHGQRVYTETANDATSATEETVPASDDEAVSSIWEENYKRSLRWAAIIVAGTLIAFAAGVCIVRHRRNNRGEESSE